MIRWIGFGLAAASLGLVGCGSDDGGTEAGDGNTTVEPQKAPAFPDGTGQVPNADVLYPAPPYGFKKGSVIENNKFVGYINSFENKVLGIIQMSDFYNPTGDAVYPEGSPWGAGVAKPKALMIDFSASWCPPCKDEAKNILPGKFDQYAPGGQILLQLIEGPSGANAVLKDLDKWTTSYEVKYPSLIDPENKMFEMVEATGIPTNVIVDTRTMEIVTIIEGSPSSSFWTKFQSVIDGD